MNKPQRLKDLCARANERAPNIDIELYYEAVRTELPALLSLVEKMRHALAAAEATIPCEGKINNMASSLVEQSLELYKQWSEE